MKVPGGYRVLSAFRLTPRRYASAGRISNDNNAAGTCHVGSITIFFIALGELSRLGTGESDRKGKGREKSRIEASTVDSRRTLPNKDISSSTVRLRSFHPHAGHKVRASSR